MLRLFAKAAPRQPDAFAHLLRALDFQLAPTKEVALIGDDLDELAAVVRSRYRPHLVLAGGPEGSDRPATCSPTEPPSTASLPPTSASASPAGARNRLQNIWSTSSERMA